jgi:hypothetical protein
MQEEELSCLMAYMARGLDRIHKSWGKLTLILIFALFIVQLIKTLF